MGVAQLVNVVQGAVGDVEPKPTSDVLSRMSRPFDTSLMIFLLITRTTHLFSSNP